MTSPTLTFLGAVDTVTGSRFLVEGVGGRLLVDAGLFQGVPDVRRRNWAPLTWDPPTLDAVVLTHAHLDHSGYLPRLVREGFGGPIYCTGPTAEPAAIVLEDSAHLHLICPGGESLTTVHGSCAIGHSWPRGGATTLET